MQAASPGQDAIDMVSSMAAFERAAAELERSLLVATKLPMAMAIPPVKGMQGQEMWDQQCGEVSRGLAKVARELQEAEGRQMARAVDFQQQMAIYLQKLNLAKRELAFNDERPAVFDAKNEEADATVTLAERVMAAATLAAGSEAPSPSGRSLTPALRRSPSSGPRSENGSPRAQKRVSFDISPAECSTSFDISSTATGQSASPSLLGCEHSEAAAHIGMIPPAQSPPQQSAASPSTMQLARPSLPIPVLPPVVQAPPQGIQGMKAGAVPGAQVEVPDQEIPTGVAPAPGASPAAGRTVMMSPARFGPASTGPTSTQPPGRGPSPARGDSPARGFSPPSTFVTTRAAVVPRRGSAPGLENMEVPVARPAAPPVGASPPGSQGAGWSRLVGVHQQVPEGAQAHGSQRAIAGEGWPPQAGGMNVRLGTPTSGARTPAQSGHTAPPAPQQGIRTPPPTPALGVGGGPAASEAAGGTGGRGSGSFPGAVVVGAAQGLHEFRPADRPSAQEPILHNGLRTPPMAHRR